jgi:hypothetical protein
MRLADRIAQCRTPFLVQSTANDKVTRLTGAADFTQDILKCPTRYILCDDLTRLCTALAYSKGARTLACADLLHVPAERVWVEWCEAPWLDELSHYGFRPPPERVPIAGRRGALIQSSPDGRRGLIRTFWSIGNTDSDVLTSSMEAYFDLDTEDGEEPVALDLQDRRTISVFDHVLGKSDILRRCFRFRYENTWGDYYARAVLSPHERDAVARHALGTIAIDIPMVLAFFLLLSTRPSLPRRPLMLERLNRSRSKSGKERLLDQIEVFSPVMPAYPPSISGSSGVTRRAPRLHHVRGHLVRRGSEIFWRVPHLRGNARSGAIHSRTVTWTIDPSKAGRGASEMAAV